MTRNERYRVAVDALIGQATRFADLNAAEDGNRTVRYNAWNRLFHAKMDELCAKAGLRRQAWQGAKP